MSLLPFFVAGQMEATSATGALQTVAPSLLDATWQAPASRPEGATMTGATAEGNDSLAAIAWTSSDNGSAGLIYAAAAPDYPAMEETFAQIVESFSISGTTQPSEGPAYQTFRDPTEGAFTVEIPQGWSSGGAVVRPCPVFLQAYVEALAEDGEMYIKMGDDYPLVTEPAPGFGLPAGSTYPHPCGYQSPVADYLPGASFVTDYLLPQRRPDAQITDVRDRSDLASSLMTLGINSYDAGEVEYIYSIGGSEYRGIVLVITERLGTDLGAQWHVWRLYMAEARSDLYPQALSAAVHMAETLRIDERWAIEQARLTQQQVQIISDMSSEISNTISEGYWGRDAIYDAIFEARSDATLETEDFVDPVTGDSYELDQSPEYYWIDPSGTIVGTDTSAKPDVDFRELIRLET